MSKLPVLLNADMSPAGDLYPVVYQRTQQLKPLSTAKLELKHGALSPRAFVALGDEIYRVTNLSITGGGLTEATLQHGLCTLSDHMHPGEESKSGSLRTLLTDLLSNQTRWVLGDCEVPDDKDLKWEINNSNNLQSLLDIMNELPAYRIETDQTTLPWVLHIRTLSQDVRSEARMERNLSEIRIDYDTTDMCTVAYADGLDAPVTADSSDVWGEIARHVSVDDGLETAMIRESVDRYLGKSKDPKVTITLTALELSKLTGDPIDRFRIGDLCRCVLPDIGLTTVQRIVTIDQPDVIEEPEYILLTLASTLDELSTAVAGLVVDTRLIRQQMQKNLMLELESIAVLAEVVYAKADLIRLEALEVQVAGLLKVDELQAAIADLDDVAVTSLSVGGTAHCTNLEVWGQASCYGLTIYGETAATQEWVAEQGYLTLVPNNYALRSWVIETFATSSDVSTSLSTIYELLSGLENRVSALEK